jgi:uncharacterized repeat protein (TIGR04052 family)
MKSLAVPLLLTLLSPVNLLAGDEKVAIRFQAMVGKETFACGQSYEGIGTTGSRISPRDFRFYIHNVRLVDESGNAFPLQLEQDGKWQLDDVALLDFENATGACGNGTPEINDRITGSVPAGRYTALRFTLGVPFSKNHSELISQPPPLNLTALAWAWNAGRKFARLDFSSAGLPRGFAIHLGSTGCTPNQTSATIPTQCGAPNRPEVEITSFNLARDVVVADLAALLKDSNVDSNQEGTAQGCMSAPNDSDCAPIFANLGLPFGETPARKQTFFRKAGDAELLTIRAAK